MPLYEYECSDCGERFEVIQKFSDKPVKTCRKCGGKKVERLISSSAIQFKGTGWYVTDYARKGSSSDDSKSGASDSRRLVCSASSSIEIDSVFIVNLAPISS